MDQIFQADSQSRSPREAGYCGCGTLDVDTDGDGTRACEDNCPNDPL